MIFNILQLIGGIILAFGSIPQIIQIFKTHSARDINIVTNVSVFVGITLMEVYAINLAINNTAQFFLVTNTMSLILAGVMCGLILRYKNKRKSIKIIYKKGRLINDYYKNSHL